MAEFSKRPEMASGPAADLWRRTLSLIPTHFGRLVYLARLREAGTGCYLYRPLIEMVGREITDRTLASSHHQVFTEWIALPLAGQKADLDQYLSDNRSSVDPAAYRALVPAAAHEVERQLYLTDLETLLELLRYEPGGAFSTQGA